MKPGDLVRGSFGSRADHGVLINIDAGLDPSDAGAKHYDILWADESVLMRYHEDTVAGYVRVYSPDKPGGVSKCK